LEIDKNILIDYILGYLCLSSRSPRVSLEVIFGTKNVA